MLKFDAYYYAHDCGRPYKRDEVWLAFFGKVADHIVQEIAPHTVLDAGCAMGFLVESLRRRGVEAFGVDISAYAIEHVHPDVRPYCWVGSITDPFPQRYDLIVSIEVVEHMPAEEAQRAIANICRHTDDVLFSSTPFDYQEVTHVNVREPESWAEAFARHGFFRDVDFDASFITPWAVRYRHSDEPVHRLVRAYERRYWPLWKENVDLRVKVAQMTEEARRLEAEVAELRTVLQGTRQEYDAYRQKWTAFQGTAGWAVVKRLQRLRGALAPPRSRRDRFVEWCLRQLRRRHLL